MRRSATGVRDHSVNAPHNHLSLRGASPPRGEGAKTDICRWLEAPNRPDLG